MKIEVNISAVIKEPGMSLQDINEPGVYEHLTLGTRHLILVLSNKEKIWLSQLMGGEYVSYGLQTHMGGDLWVPSNATITFKGDN